MQPNHAYSVENLCSSVSNAVFSAFSNIRAGLADVILVIGADKHDGPGKILDTDISRGRFSKPVYWASLFASIKRKYGANVEQIASVSAKNHLYAKNNPLALHPAEYSIDDVLGSKKITSDLRMYECSRTCTGASAVLLASESRPHFSRITFLPHFGVSSPRMRHIIRTDSSNSAMQKYP